MTIVVPDPTTIQSTSHSILSNKNQTNGSLEIVDENTDGSMSDVQGDSDNDPNWEMKYLNYKGINKNNLNFEKLSLFVFKMK